jgi:hypothetical protein
MLNFFTTPPVANGIKLLKHPTMNFFSEVFTILFGGASAAMIVANFIMYLVGAAIVFVFDLRGRDKTSERTPEKFSPGFFLKDNAARMVITLLIGMLVLIVGNELGSLTGVQLPTVAQRFMPLLAGLFSDWISLAIKNKIKNNTKPD